MEYDQSPEDDMNANVRKWWIGIFCLSLFFLALCWSVDRSIVYLISAVVAFSLFKIFQLWKREERPYQSHPWEKTRDERPYEQYRPNAFSVFIEDVKQIFKKDSRSAGTPQQSRVFVMLVAGFIGFIFFISIIGAFLGDEDSSSDYYYSQRAQDYYNARQYDSATYYYRLAIEADPGNADLYVQRGNAFLNLQKNDSAISMYDQAMAVDPLNQQAQYNKGYVYFDQKNYRQAIDETRKVLATEPDHTDALLLMGDSFYNQSQLDSALYWYEGAYSTGYRSAILCHLMAYIYDTKGQQQTAINLYKEAIGQDSSTVEIYTRLGELVPGEEGNWYRIKAAKMK